MQRKSSQRGLTLIGFVMVLMVVGFFAFVAIKLFPVYSEYYAVVQDMNGIRQEPGVANMEPNIIKDKLFRRFYVSYVTSVKPNHVKITRSNGYNMTVDYEVRRPLVGNLDFVAKFQRTVDLTRQGGDD